MPEKHLIVVSTGGFGREVIWLARDCGGEVIGALDLPDLKGQEVCGVPILGGDAECVAYPDAHYVVALGEPRLRKSVVDRLLGYAPVKFATLVHPNVRMSEFVEVGEGTMVTAGCIVTTQVAIGRHCILNLATTVGHDVSIGDFCTLSPHTAVSGRVTIGDGVELGTGACVIPRVSIGSGALVGAGAVVNKDVAPNAVAVGVPAKQIKEIEPLG